MTRKAHSSFFSDLSTYKPDQWNIYSEIRRKLVEDHNIPEKQIKFIQEANSDNARKELFKDMNSGRIRFLSVHTETGNGCQRAGTGRGHPSSGHTLKAVRPGTAQRTGGRKGNIIAKQYAGNKVDCYIYAVEKSLDSYKFNLLQNKQVFINQLKSRNLAARTIDEGAIDENGGGSFSEYVAILSGNDDLLEKAKLDKKLAVLESERQAFYRNKGNAKGKLNERTSGIEKNNTFIGRFTRDWEYFNKVMPADTETGLRPNPLKLDGVDSDNVEILGNRLAAINGMSGRRMTI